MSPRRILLTTDVVGGVWDFCLTLTGGLRAAGDDVVLLALGTPTPAQSEAAQRAGATLVSAPLRLEWMANSEKDVETTRTVVRQVAEQTRADVVHANQFAAACAEVDVPVVLTIHSDVLSWRRWTLGDSNVAPEWHAYSRLVSDAASRATELVAVSRFLADQVVDLYAVTRPIRVVHNGWPAPAQAEATRERITVAAGRIWDAAKNIALVAEAATGWDHGPVYLAGETSHPDGGTAGVPQPLEPVGFLERDALDALLSRARVYVSPARYDPFGLLPLQAALHGCQLLLSDIPSYREVWGETATYFRSDDVSDLRRAWQRLLNAPGENPSTRARQTLSVDRMVECYRSLYSTVRSAVAA
ncbi:MAG: glycosyltransferase family 4 protein [Chloroflexi bacterium]|nr:glycosyltransferase family 4 protein [Chloroflexota bacterium]